MALESKLGSGKVPGKEMPAPDLAELAQDYFHAATVYATPSNPSDYAADLERVLILRPTMERRRPKDMISVENGYFAYGHRENNRSVFHIYIPKRGALKGHPSKSLKESLGNFMLRLAGAGYTINGISYAGKP